MKQCPACKTSYTDETLSYCLSDGQPLVSAAQDFDTVVSHSGEATAVFGQVDKMRVEIPQESSISNFSAPDNAQTAPVSGGGLKIFVGVAVAVVILAAIAVVGGLAFYFGSRSGDITSNNNPDNRMPTPAPSPSATTDDKEELRRQIANLEKRLNEQKNSNRPANTQVTIPQQSTTTTARVNSPDDGFLALRSLPNSEAGERILKIPHGATISIGACGPVTRPVRRAGRWCQASYNGYSGWVFDAYLIY